MDKLNESYVVTLVDRGGDHLKAIADDGIHGIANCQFPRDWHGISRYDKSNHGRKFEVDNLRWTGKFYRVAPIDIIKELTDDVIFEPSTVKTIEKSIDEPAEKSIDKPAEKSNSFKVGLDFFENLVEDLDCELNRYEVYN